MAARGATDRASFITLSVAALAASVLLATRVGYAPIWDGRIYAACIAAAAEHFSAESLRCAGHASQGYAALAALAIAARSLCLARSRDARPVFA